MGSSRPHSNLDLGFKYRLRRFLRQYAVWHNLPHLTSSLSTKHITLFYVRPGAKLLRPSPTRAFLGSLLPRPGYRGKALATFSIDSLWVQLCKGSLTVADYHRYVFSRHLLSIPRASVRRWETLKKARWLTPSTAPKSPVQRLITTSKSRQGSERRYFAYRSSMLPMWRWKRGMRGYRRSRSTVTRIARYAGKL